MRRLTDRSSALRAARQAVSALDTAFIRARGAGGHVIFNGRAVVIDRRDTPSFILHGLVGPQVLSLADIREVRLHPARRRAQGRLQFITSGARPSGGGAADPHSVFFDAPHRDQFAALARAVREAVEEAKQPVLVTSRDDRREAGRLMDLRGRGLIDQEEFLSLTRPSAPAADRPRALALSRAEPEPASVAALAPSVREMREAFVARWAAAPQWDDT